MTQRDAFTVALVGAGNMGGAMLGGWLTDGLPARSIVVIDPSPAPHIQNMISEAGVRHESSAVSGLHPDVLILAVKPQVMGKVLTAVTDMVGPATVVVSVAAGKTIGQIENGLGSNTAVIRAMPNTPALIQRGITVACANANVVSQQRHRVDELLRATGSVAWIDDESLIDAVTALSGSGPAYIFYLAECMAAAGVAAGLPDELAMQLACETVSGAGELLARSHEGPARLRENVTSPNGTTAAALGVLMAENGLKPLMEKAIQAAKQRGTELSGG